MAVFEAVQALGMAMAVEKNGEAFYEAAAERSDDAEVKALFEDLAGKEEAHYRAFEQMLEDTDPMPASQDEDVQEYQSYLETALDHAIFAGPDKALRMAEQAEDRKAALRAAMGFEKDTMLFYYDLREMVDESDREVVTDIIREEKDHLRRLAKLV